MYKYTDEWQNKNDYKVNILRLFYFKDGIENYVLYEIILFLRNCIVRKVNKLKKLFIPLCGKYVKENYGQVSKAIH